MLNRENIAFYFRRAREQSPERSFSKVALALNREMDPAQKKNLKRVMVRDGMCGASVEALKNRHFKLIPS